MKRLYHLNRWRLVLVLAIISGSAQAQEPPSDASEQASAPCSTCNNGHHHSFLYRWWHKDDEPKVPDEGKAEREEFCKYVFSPSVGFFRNPSVVPAPLPPESIR